MAITNAQQYQQLVNKPANGKRPGYRGDDANKAREARSREAKSSNKTSNKTSTTSSSNNNDDNRQTYNVDKKTVKTGPKPTDTRTLTSKDYDRGQSNFREQFDDTDEKYKEFGGYSGGARLADSDYRNFSGLRNQKYQNRIYNQARTNIINQLQQADLLTDEDDDMTVEQLRDKFQVSDDANSGTDYGNRSLNLDELKGIKSIQDYVNEGFYKKGGDFDNDPNNPNYKKDRIPGPFKPTGFPILDLMGKKMAGPLTQEYLTKQFNNLEDISSIPFNYKDDNSIKGLMERYEPNRYEREYGDNTGGGENQQQTDPCLGPNPPAYCNINNTPADPATPKRNLGGLAPRFAGSIFDFTGLANGGRAGYADGGMMEDTPEGGIMDLESGRQMYFLGKLVKKATRAVKKVVKSPIGKAALMYGLGAMGGSYGAGKGFFSKGMFNLGNMKTGLFGQAMKSGYSGPGIPGLFNKLGLTKTAGSMMPTLKGIFSASTLAGLMADKEEEDNGAYEKYIKDMGIDIDRHRYAPYRTLAPGIIGSNYQTGTQGRKDGGRMGYAEGSKEPVAKETMPLIDMDGKEMDLRAEGGFVPLGRMERADDVPARLSKNEFVFTADAVRNAGEGDIDKGAEVMYNMMKNLESGGEVSEESQGLEGAKEMFKTSQRLEEVL